MVCEDLKEEASVVAENSICVEIVEVVDLLLAFIRHTQPYINDAQFPVQPISSPSRNAGRDHRALPSSDRASTNAKDMGFSAATDGRGSERRVFMRSVSQYPVQVDKYLVWTFY